MKVKIENGKILLFNSYHERERLKALGARFDRRLKAWWFSYDLDSCEVLRQHFGLKIDPPKLPRFNPQERDFIIPKLYKHQQDSVRKARGLPYFADFSEPGTGKTLVQIELMLERNEWPVLVICPKSIMEAVWEKQLLENTNDAFIIWLLNGGSQKVKEKLFKIHFNTDQVFSAPNIAIINYEMVPRVINELLKIDWAVVILDESTRIKNPTAKRSKAVLKLRDKARWRAIMTGTPAPNGLLDLFNQIRFLDPRLFGDSWYAFRERYMFQYKFEWHPRPGAIEKVKHRLAPFSVAWKKRQCVDLPPLVHEIRRVDMTTVQARAYRQMKEELILELKETTVVAPFVMTKLMKLRQIASGFVYANGKAIPVCEEPPKFRELINLLDELGDVQVIVFAHFRETLWLLANKLGDVAANILEDHQKALNEFLTGKKRILLANPASAGHGLNLQFCSNVIFYELDFSLENFLQSIQRIERIGQTDKMTVFHLLTKGTLEPWILRKLQSKEDLNKKLDINEVVENI